MTSPSGPIVKSSLLMSLHTLDQWLQHHEEWTLTSTGGLCRPPNYWSLAQDKFHGQKPVCEDQTQSVSGLLVASTPVWFWLLDTIEETSKETEHPLPQVHPHHVLCPQWTELITSWELSQSCRDQGTITIKDTKRCLEGPSCPHAQPLHPKDELV